VATSGSASNAPEMAGAVAAAVRESAEALLRAEEAEAALAEREEELGAALDEATRAKDALELTRSDLYPRVSAHEHPFDPRQSAFQLGQWRLKEDP